MNWLDAHTGNTGDRGTATSVAEQSIIKVPFNITCRGQCGYEVVVTKVTETHVEGYVDKKVFKVKNHGDYFKRGGGSTSGVNRFYFADVGDAHQVIQKLRIAKIKGLGYHLTVAQVHQLVKYVDGA